MLRVQRRTLSWSLQVFVEKFTRDSQEDAAHPSWGRHGVVFFALKEKPKRLSHESVTYWVGTGEGECRSPTLKYCLRGGWSYWAYL